MNKTEKEDIHFMVMDLFESFLRQQWNEDFTDRQEKIDWFDARLRKELYLD